MIAGSKSCFSDHPGLLTRMMILFTLLFYSSCTLPPHHAKEKVSVTDTIYIDSAMMKKESAQEQFNYEFEKLDYRVLQQIFRSDTLSRSGYVYWEPTIDELIEKNQHSSLCSSRIENIYYFSGGKSKYAFVLFFTYDELAGKGYHSSAPIVGGATFVRTADQKWSLWNVNKTMTRHGERGEPEPYAFVLIGKNDHALRLMLTYSGTGTISEFDFFYDLLTLQEIISFPSGESNAPSYSENDPEFYNYSSAFNFIQSSVKEARYYDLEIVTEGTYPDRAADSVYNIRRVLLYRYNVLRGIYEPVCEK